LCHWPLILTDLLCTLLWPVERPRDPFIQSRHCRYIHCTLTFRWYIGEEIIDAIVSFDDLLMTSIDWQYCHCWYYCYSDGIIDQYWYCYRWPYLLFSIHWWLTRRRQHSWWWYILICPVTFWCSHITFVTHSSHLILIFTVVDVV